MAQTFSRKLLGGMIGIGLLMLTIGSTSAVGASVPASYPYGYSPYTCAVVYGCAPAAYGTIPSGATLVPGVSYAYKDNRYCGDGNVVFTGGGYVCANGSPLYVTNGAHAYAVVAPYVYANTAPLVPVPVYAALYR